MRIIVERDSGENEEYVIKSVPLFDKGILRTLQRRYFLISGNLRKRYCIKCRAAEVVTIYARTVSFPLWFYHLFFNRHLKVEYCSKCGIVQPDEVLYGYELLDEIMRYVLNDAFREYENRIEIINSLDFQKQFEVFVLYTGLGFKTDLDFKATQIYQNYIEEITGKDDQPEGEKKNESN